MCDFIYPTKYVNDKDLYNLIYRSWYTDLPSVNDLRIAVMLQQRIENERNLND